MPYAEFQDVSFGVLFCAKSWVEVGLDWGLGARESCPQVANVSCPKRQVDYLIYRLGEANLKYCNH